MDKGNCWRSALLCAGLISMSVAGLFPFPLTDEKKDVPDHTSFQSCKTCHAEKDQMWAASKHGEAIRSIAQNNTGATDCGACHSSKRPDAGIRSSSADGSQTKHFHAASCLACHSRQDTGNSHRTVLAPDKLCDLCHTQRAVFWGKGAKGIEDSRNFHSGVACVSCHMTEGNHRMKVLRPDDPGLTEKRLDTCTACHKDNNREARVEQIQEWQSTYDENMNPLLADVRSIEAALKQNPDRLDAALKSKLADVKANLSILEKDGSRGFHNFPFSLEITAAASGNLKEIKAACGM
jgi:hypothetical protein